MTARVNTTTPRLTDAIIYVFVTEQEKSDLKARVKIISYLILVK